MSNLRHELKRSRLERFGPESTHVFAARWMNRHEVNAPGPMFWIRRGCAFYHEATEYRGREFAYDVKTWIGRLFDRNGPYVALKINGRRHGPPFEGFKPTW